MSRLQTEYENKFLDDFTEENLIGTFIKVEFNNDYYRGYIIGLMEDNIIVKFEKENEIWKINRNNNIYTLLVLEKKMVDIRSNLMNAIKRKLKKENIIKNCNCLEIQTTTIKKNQNCKPDKAKWKKNYIATEELIKSNSLKSNKYLNSWFNTQKNYFKNKRYLLKKKKYQIKITNLIQLYDSLKLKPKKLEIDIPKTNDITHRNRREIELDDLNRYTEEMNSNYEVAFQSPSSLSRSCTTNKINHYIRNLTNLHRDIDTIKDISKNRDIKNWLNIIMAKIKFKKN